MSRLFVFRSLPLDADSRTARNVRLFKGEESYSCTWEKNSSEHEGVIHFPFYKSGGRIARAMKYLCFLLWVPYIVVTKAKEDDVIIFMDLETILFGGVLAKIKGITVIFDIVDPCSQTKRSASRMAKVIDYIEYKWANAADILMVPHESRLQYYEDVIGTAVKSHNHIIIENVPSYRNPPPKKQRAQNGAKIVVGYFGTLDYGTRGLERLISLAIENSSKISVVFAGQGGMEQELISLSSKYENIKFEGVFNAETLPHLYTQVDFTWAYYCPNIKLHKYAAPNKFYEHLYFNTPIITSSVIPQYPLIQELNSGVSIDLELDSDSNIIKRLSDLKKGNSLSEDNSIGNYWLDNYENYYQKVQYEFEGLLANGK